MSLECPVCGIRVPAQDLQTHLIGDHYLFMVVLRSLYMNDPEANAFMDDDSYEDLSDLCDQMGSVAIGADVDAETTIIITDTPVTCPVCLEDHSSNIRKINDCGHKFCATCIETWLSSHKTCPICKAELMTSHIVQDTRPRSPQSPLPALRPQYHPLQLQLQPEIINELVDIFRM